MTMLARDRRPTVAAATLATFALATTALTIALAITNRDHLSDIGSVDASSIAVPIGAGLLGFLVASRRPRNACGWLLLVVALTSSLQGATDQYARFASTARGVPGAVWAEWISAIVLPLLFPSGAVLLLLLLLPDGHLPSRRWRPLVLLAMLNTAVLFLMNAFAPGPLSTSSSGANYPDLPNPLGVDGLKAFAGGNTVAASAVWFTALLLLLVTSTVPLLRMRRAHGDERQQLKWIAYAVLVTVVAVVAFVFLAGTVLPSWTFDVPIILGFGVAFPIAIGVAVFKYRLYEIDVVISRTIVYSTLAAFITAVYVGIAVGIGTLVGSGGKPNLGLSILATAIVAVGFQPVRERVQKIANRLVYGKRATPYEVLAQFSERVAESYAADEVMPRMARVLAEGTGAQRTDVWLRSGATWRDAAVWPVDAPRSEVLPTRDDALPAVTGNLVMVEVRHQGDLLGALSVTKRTGESLTPVEENLLAHLAGQAGLVLKNVGLASDLQARLVELRASRQRLVTAQDEERRRLERNLHDGAQQHLVALKVKLGLAEMLMARDPQKAMATLEQLKGDADEALETLRDLARGIYPPLLAEKGLVAALESQARKATVPVSVGADGVGRYSQDVEAAVYFSVLEALQNVQKYAQASAVTVTLRQAGGQLQFCVGDDGRGFDTATVVRGSGLVNMSDRVDSLGGAIAIDSTLGSGTRLKGSIPVYDAMVAADQASTSLSGLNSDLGMKPAAPTSSA